MLPERFITPSSMYACFVRSLRSIAAMLVPCGMLATLVLPRAHGEVGNASPQPGQKHPALLVAEGLPFIIIRSSGRIAMASRSARRLFALRSGVGGNLLSLTAGSEAQEAIRRAIGSPFERTEYFRVAFPGTGGEQRLYRMESAPMAEGDATGVVLRDITHSSGEAYPCSDARVVEAASSMAGPLSVLSGWLETVRESGATLSPAALRAMERQVARLRELAAELGEEQADNSLLCGSFDLASVVQRAADKLVPRMVETGSRLELSYAETPFMLRGDTSLWQQFIGELLASALREPAARRLSLSAEYQAAKVIVEIASDGPCAWEAASDGSRSRFDLVQSAIRAQHGELQWGELGSSGSLYRLTFPA